MTYLTSKFAFLKQKHTAVCCETAASVWVMDLIDYTFIKVNQQLVSWLGEYLLTTILMINELGFIRALS